MGFVCPDESGRSRSIFLVDSDCYITIDLWLDCRGIAGIAHSTYLMLSECTAIDIAHGAARQRDEGLELGSRTFIIVHACGPSTGRGIPVSCIGVGHRRRWSPCRLLF